jgi:hypothetical protein
MTNVDSEGFGKERGYCSECYKAGKGKNRIRMTVERLEVCECGTVLNQHNQSGECGACRVKRLEARKAEVLGAERVDSSSEVPEAKREAIP